MAEFAEELEPLFDYRRIQPRNVVFLDDDESGASPKRRKISNPMVEKVVKDGKVVHVLDIEEKENEDWLPPPPKITCDASVLAENSTIKELRLKKQELASFAQSAQDVLRAMEESAKIELGKSLQPSTDAAADQPKKPLTERNKIVISIQDKDGLKQFRIYMDDKFERLFKLYADRVKLDLRTLVFCFDGEKIGPQSTPDALGMEDNDMIEVHVKSS
ncbi:Rad60/SUMO-like domain containing protein [Parasponia andersonii]|uniref:Rad60/SUMO-like domain containing protein n=1 Tax=Parasponia andersonii TaxID=3476 RepID=A0A2P5DKC9_PARAD|nr:Rad60/SUMO-like domain containing protein [Parasponia andersonii]